MPINIIYLTYIILYLNAYIIQYIHTDNIILYIEIITGRCTQMCIFKDIQKGTINLCNNLW